VRQIKVEFRDIDVIAGSVFYGEWADVSGVRIPSFELMVTTQGHVAAGQF